MGAGRFPAAMTTTSGSTSILVYPQRVGVCVGCDPHSGDEHSHGVCQPLFAAFRRLFVVELVFVSVGPLVPVGSRAPRGASTSGLSTR